MELRLEEFARCVELAERLETPLIWLWNLPTNLARALRSLRGQIVFHRVEVAGDPFPTLAVFDRRDESLWIVGGVRGGLRLVDALAPRELWLGEASWHQPVLDGLRRAARGATREIHHLRRRPPAALVAHAPPGCGVVTRCEVDQLRSFDAIQYGQPLDVVVDYGALADEGLVYAARAPGGQLAATALIGRPGRRVFTVSSLWTRPELRRRGHAHNLMSSVLATCQAEDRVCVLNVEADNHPALALYRRLGFVHADTVICAEL